jgi:hypothetical protein
MDPKPFIALDIASDLPEVQKHILVRKGQKWAGAGM